MPIEKHQEFIARRGVQRALSEGYIKKIGGIFYLTEKAEKIWLGKVFPHIYIETKKLLPEEDPYEFNKELQKYNSHKMKEAKFQLILAYLWNMWQNTLSEPNRRIEH